MDIEIFGLASTSKFDIPRADRVGVPYLGLITHLLPKKGTLLDSDPPLPPASAGHGRIDPEGRHADVAERPDNFCLHLHDPPSDPSYGEHSPVHVYGL